MWICQYDRMRRTTISWPAEVAEAVEREAERRRKSVSEIVRESVVAHLFGQRKKARAIPWIGMIDNPKMVQGKDVDDYLAAHWADDIARDRG